jgi:hypothetical protein
MYWWGIRVESSLKVRGRVRSQRNLVNAHLPTTAALVKPKLS